jgi:hypothetical protein
MKHTLPDSFDDLEAKEPPVPVIGPPPYVPADILPPPVPKPDILEHNIKKRIGHIFASSEEIRIAMRNKREHTEQLVALLNIPESAESFKFFVAGEQYEMVRNPKVHVKLDISEDRLAVLMSTLSKEDQNVISESMAGATGTKISMKRSQWLKLTPGGRDDLRRLGSVLVRDGEWSVKQLSVSVGKKP